MVFHMQLSINMTQTQLMLLLLLLPGNITKIRKSFYHSSKKHMCFFPVALVKFESILPVPLEVHVFAHCNNLLITAARSTCASIIAVAFDMLCKTRKFYCTIARGKCGSINCVVNQFVIDGAAASAAVSAGL